MDIVPTKRKEPRNEAPIRFYVCYPLGGPRDAWGGDFRRHASLLAQVALATPHHDYVGGVSP
jgi:hypothetical protein